MNGTPWTEGSLRASIAYGYEDIAANGLAGFSFGGRERRISRMFRRFEELGNVRAACVRREIREAGDVA